MFEFWKSVETVVTPLSVPVVELLEHGWEQLYIISGAYDSWRKNSKMENRHKSQNWKKTGAFHFILKFFN